MLELNYIVALIYITVLLSAVLRNNFNNGYLNTAIRFIFNSILPTSQINLKILL